MERIGKECIYMYNGITWLYSRDWHNIVNQLYSNKKKKITCWEWEELPCNVLYGFDLCQVPGCLKKLSYVSQDFWVPFSFSFSSPLRGEHSRPLRVHSVCCFEGFETFISHNSGGWKSEIRVPSTVLKALLWTILLIVQQIGTSRIIVLQEGIRNPER